MPSSSPPRFAAMGHRYPGRHEDTQVPSARQLHVEFGLYIVVCECCSCAMLTKRFQMSLTVLASPYKRQTRRQAPPVRFTFRPRVALGGRMPEEFQQWIRRSLGEASRSHCAALAFAANWWLAYPVSLLLLLGCGCCATSDAVQQRSSALLLQSVMPRRVCAFSSQLPFPRSCAVCIMSTGSTMIDFLPAM